MRGPAIADGLTLAFQIGTLLAVLLFVVRYGVTTWRRSPGGRNVMAFALMFVVFTGLVLVRRVIPPAAGPYVRVIAWGVVFGVWCWRDQLLFRFQRQSKGSKDHEPQT
jgi:hypothetical protein